MTHVSETPNERSIEISEETFNDVLKFSDWRLYRTSSAEAHGYPAQSNKDITPKAWQRKAQLSEHMQKFLSTLLEACVGRGPWDCFSVDFFHSSRRIRFRVQEMNGFYACKLIPTTPPELDQLQNLAVARDILMSRDRLSTGGLILMTGEPGTGKTTTATATLRARLLAYGGYCIAMGDPPEQPIAEFGQRTVGRGYVDEIDVSQIGYREGLKHALRSFPIGQRGMLLYGEIRSDSNAADILNIACDGHEVTSTVHAMSPDAALDRVITSAVLGSVPHATARNLLAQSLKGIVHHKVVNGQFIVEPFAVTEHIAYAIREGESMPFQTAKQVSGSFRRS